jgi:hypothetical protein
VVVDAARRLLGEDLDRAVGGPGREHPVVADVDGVRGTGRLGDAFNLEFFDGESLQRGGSPEWLWEMSYTSVGPVKAATDRLDADQRAQARADSIEYFGRYRAADGTVAVPREYLVILGHRKTR